MVDAADGTDASAADANPAEKEDDFFNSWNKPTINRPSNPPSRSTTPAISRSSSPFLNAPGNAAARSKSPLGPGSDGVADSAPPTISARRPQQSTAAKKPSILGAKKTKLGAKKVDASLLDFDAAEREAKDHADRIEKLGYDPDAGPPPVVNSVQPNLQDTSTVASPLPVNPSRTASFGQTKNDSNADVERLGMGVRKLGFGQIGGGGAAAAPAKPKMGGFGSTSRPAIGQSLYRRPVLYLLICIDDSDKTARTKFSGQSAISSDQFFGRDAYDPAAQADAKARSANFDGATAISSNAYFGRPEQDTPDGEYGDLESAAKDIVRNFGITAGDDLDNLTNLLGEGAVKLQGQSSIVPTCLAVKADSHRRHSGLYALTIPTL